MPCKPPVVLPLPFARLASAVAPKVPASAVLQKPKMSGLAQAKMAIGPPAAILARTAPPAIAPRPALSAMPVRPPATPFPAHRHAVAAALAATARVAGPVPPSASLPGRTASGTRSLQAKAAALTRPPIIPGRALIQRASMLVDDDELEEDDTANDADDEAEIGGWQDYGSRVARQGAKVFYIEPHKVDASSNSKLERLFVGSGQIREKKSYKNLRHIQTLRWIATVLHKKFTGAVEIQCYYHEGRVYISSNKNQVNDTMLAAFQANKLITQVNGNGRYERHYRKLMGTQKYKEHKEIMELLAQGKIVIVPSDSALDCDLHAERRIRRYLKDIKLDANFLAGTRRPCLACAVALELDPHASTGPLWTTASGQGGLAEKDIKRIAREKQYRVHVSRSRNTGKLTYDINTDSDTDAE